MRMIQRTRDARRLSAIGAVALALVVLVPGSASGSAEQQGVAQAVLRDASGATVGRVVLTTTGGSVVVAVHATGLTSGFHGFHVHAVGVCEAPFTTAGGHHNPAGAGHGDHAGDMPVLLAQQSGTANSVVQTDRFTVASLMDADGSAIIVHADRDNLAHIPVRYTSATTGLPGPDAATLATGDAGARFACGVITR